MKLIIVIFTIFSTVACATNYCEICTNHVACNNSGEFALPEANLLEINEDAKQVLLDAHNKVRNKIAGGEETGFSTASKMMTLQWDDELAYFAELNVKKCRMAHDRCIKTRRFMYAGQNIFMMGESSYTTETNDFLKLAVTEWYNEVTNAQQKDIDKCCGGTKFAQIGHFTAIVKDRSVALGCASSRYSEDGWKMTLLCCNYSYGNMLNSAVYTSGVVGSKCPNGTDEKYNNLCKV